MRLRRLCLGSAAGAFAMLVILAPALAQDNAKAKEVYEPLNVFGSVLSTIEKNYIEKLDQRSLVQSAIRGIAKEIDPRSEYYDPQEYRDIQVPYPFGGVGLEFKLVGGRVTIVTPLDGTPAQRAGLLPADVVTHVDGKDLTGLSLRNVRKLLVGHPNTSVSLTIVRDARDQPLEISLRREVIRLVAVRAVAEGEIGYVRISAFHETTQVQLAKAVEGLKAEIGDKLKGYIIDLRNNAGGLLDQAVRATDAFLESGAIVEVRGREPSEVMVHQATPGDLAKGMPIVVLVNGGTAAGAEIMAAALQDHRRARLVGSRTFGSGTIQTIFPLGKPGGSYGALKLTTHLHYTPLGRAIEGNPLEPDVSVTQAGTGNGPNAVPKDKNEDTQLQRALALLREGR